ncbi:MAG: hypothetical protein HOO97_03470, partial [Sideroxydans sp.]|nr:hypothetical protein [Sideroxydans sp.]
MKKIELLYQAISICPLCGGDAHKRDKLTRANYFFGVFCIPLPSEGVYLLECTVCSLLFKSAVPSQESLSIVMAGGATAVWQSKSGVHPALAWVLPHLKNQHKSVLDVGASNGDLLAQVKPFASGVSALDVVEYPQCRLVVDRE